MSRLLLALLLFAGTALGVGEAVVRGLRVEPRVVVLREAALHPSLRLGSLHGRDVWEQVESKGPGGADRQHLPCDEQPVHLLHLYGDSIAFGAGLDAADSPGPRLQDALAGHPGSPWCVQTFAQPAATLHPQLAFAQEHIPRSRPRIVLLQLWYGSPRVPTRLGDAIYYLDGLRTDDAGYPTFAAGLTGGWHHALFDASRFWAWLTFAVNPGCARCGPTWDDLIAGDLTTLHALVQDHGGRLALVMAPPLDRPLADLRADPVTWYDPVIAWADAHDVPWVRLEDVLGDGPIESLRRNTCCHYNAAGASKVASGLATWLTPMLEAVEAEGPPAP